MCMLMISNPCRGPHNIHGPFSTLSSQDAKGNEIFYSVIDDRDRQWARRLEFATKQYRDLAEDDLDELQAEYEVVIRQSKKVHERKYDQKEIAMLNKRLDQGNQAQDTSIVRINGVCKYWDAKRSNDTYFGSKDGNMQSCKRFRNLIFCPQVKIICSPMAKHANGLTAAVQQSEKVQWRIGAV
jgi:hypothetical protein